jgi:energy-converting hydrogenase Eha subunit A
MHDDNADFFVRVMRVTGAVVVGVLATAVAAVLTLPSDQDLDLKHHCEMTQLFAATNGEYGWPDYNNTAGDCPKEK